jgi:hypothetical protein
MALVAGGYAAVALGLGWLALRPLYLHAVPDWVEKLILGVAVGLPFVVAVLPGPETVVKISWFTYPGFTFRCFSYGAALALAILLAARGLDRGGHVVGRSALLAAAAGGYSGLMGLQFECPINYPLHLLTGHAIVPLGLAVGYLLFRRT